MITFVLSLAALVLGYFLYGRFVERVFGPDDRPTPAIAKADGVDFMTGCLSLDCLRMYLCRCYARLSERYAEYS